MSITINLINLENFFRATMWCKDQTIELVNAIGKYDLACYRHMRDDLDDYDEPETALGYHNMVYSRKDLIKAFDELNKSFLEAAGTSITNYDDYKKSDLVSELVELWEGAIRMHKMTENHILEAEELEEMVEM